MSNKDQYNNEIRARNAADTNTKLDSKYVYNILATSDDFDNFGSKATEALHGLSLVLDGSGSYPYAVLMEAGERNLLHIFTHERPDTHHTRSIFTQILEVEIRIRRKFRPCMDIMDCTRLVLTDHTHRCPCAHLPTYSQAIAHLHAKGIIHGDLKLLNILRSGGSRIRLIDLDAAACIGKDMAGAKVSSSAHGLLDGRTSVAAACITKLSRTFDSRRAHATAIYADARMQLNLVLC